MVPFQTIPPSEPFGWKDFFDSLFYTPVKSNAGVYSSLALVRSWV